MILTASKFSIWVTMIPTVRTGLLRKSLTEHSRDPGASLTSLFWKILVKVISSTPSQGGVGFMW